ncbi:trehalose synthase domain protein [Curtobacterium sp. ER1/6]|nr:trehalose synthase domain protein [Curtobacterium sp. ER1/6]
MSRASRPATTTTPDGATALLGDRPSDVQPVEGLRPHRQRDGPVLVERREGPTAEQVVQRPPGELRRRDRDRRRVRGEREHAEDVLGGRAELLPGPLPRAHERQHRVVVGVLHVQRPHAEDRVRLADVDHVADPVQQGPGLGELRLDVHLCVVVDERLHDGQVQLARVRGREARVAVRRPLHRRARGVAVRQPDVVAHADLVPVVEERRPGQREQQGVDELELGAGVVEQRREATANADVRPHPRVVAVPAVHRLPVLLAHHLERQLVVVAEEDAPRGLLGHVEGLGQDRLELGGVLGAERVEDARHHREVERHVALGLLVGAEERRRLARPLVRLREQDATGVLVVDHRPELLDELVGLRLALAVALLGLEEVRDRVEPQPVDPEVEPVPDDVVHGLDHGRVLEVEVGLVREEPVEEELPAHRVERPIRLLGVDEDDADVLVVLVGVAPHVEVAVGAVRVLAGLLEPLVLVRGVVDHHVDHDAHVALVRLRDEFAEVVERAELRQDRAVVRDVVAAVAHRRLEERRQPDGVDAEPLEVVQLADDALDVPDAVAVRVDERADHALVEDRTLVPLRVQRESGQLDRGREGQACSSVVGGPVAWPDPTNSRRVPLLLSAGCGHDRARWPDGRRALLHRAPPARHRPPPGAGRGRRGAAS